MKSLKNCALVSFFLGIISFIWLVVNFAALTDIWYANEPNLDVEWQVVSISFLPFTLFHISVFITLILLLKFLRQQKKLS